MEGDAAFDAVCAKWKWAKQEQAAMAKTVEQCKTAVEKMLQSKKVSEIETDLYLVKKSCRSREYMSKKDVPLNVWSKYCRPKTFSILSLHPLKSVKAKSKDKSKAKNGKK